MNLRLFSHEERQAVEFKLENAIGEELHGEWMEYEDDEVIFEITRHQANCNTDQEREWIEQMTEGSCYPSIWIDDEPTIG